jgi:HTH-type transcriptional regulator, transcriptional repressor of NAD biosynthesis genes
MEHERYPTGLIVGRFNPPHLGHSYLIEWATSRCDQLVVSVNTRDGEAVPGSLRARWLASLHDGPGVQVVENRHDLGTDWNDEDLWARWIALFRAIWPHPTGPHAVVSSDPYVAELARRLGADALICDAERARVPISATEIRERPADHLAFLTPPVRAWVEANWLG